MKTFQKAIFAAAILSPLASQAGGIYLYEMGTSDLGLAAAGTAARAEDASTVYSNPAGMTELTGDQVTIGAQALSGKFDYELDRNGALSGSDPDNPVGWLPGGTHFTRTASAMTLKSALAHTVILGSVEDFGSSWAEKSILTKATLMAVTLYSQPLRIASTINGHSEVDLLPTIGYLN